MVNRDENVRVTAGVPAILLVMACLAGTGCGNGNGDGEDASEDAAPDPDGSADAGEDGAEDPAPEPPEDAPGDGLDAVEADDGPSDALEDAPSRIAVPGQDEWSHAGTVLEPGAEGEWDHLLYGGFTGTAVKKDGSVFLYYQGALYYSEVEDSVAYRAIGAAVSSDGIHFEKYEGNPVIEWTPNGAEEEGAASGGACLTPSGEVALFYGANTFQSAGLVNADGRAALSVDGTSFTDQGLALNHTDGGVWGSGDELFPIMALHHAGTWIVYYIPNGTPQRGELGAAWGPGMTDLSSTAPALAGGSAVQVWGMGGWALIAENEVALFLNDVTLRRMEVRLADPASPDSLSAPVETYAFSDFTQGTVLLDRDRGTWFMYYRTTDPLRIDVRTAPVRYE